MLWQLEQTTVKSVLGSSSVGRPFREAMHVKHRCVCIVPPSVAALMILPSL